MMVKSSYFTLEAQPRIRNITFDVTLSLKHFRTNAMSSFSTAVNNINDSTMTRQSSQQKVGQIYGQFWLFYHDPSGFVCQTSENDQQFSTPYYILTWYYGTGGDFDLRYNTTANVLRLVEAVGDPDVQSYLFMAGNLASTTNNVNQFCGGIKWFDNVSITTTGTEPTAPSIAEDKYWSTWIVINSNQTNKFYAEVWLCAHAVSSCGSSSKWGRILNYNTGLTYYTGAGFEPEIGAFSNGDMWLVLGAVTNPYPFEIWTYSTSTQSWTNGVNSTASFTFGGVHSGSALSVGSTLYLADPDNNNFIHVNADGS